MKKLRLILFLNLGAIFTFLAFTFSGCKAQQKIKGEHAVPEAEQSTVFFFTNGGLSSLKDAAEAAHANHQRIYAVIDFTVNTDPGNAIPKETIISGIKKEVRNIVTNYDIDGLGMKISDHPLELIENMTVEAMLLKPYLVNFVVWSGDDEYKRASACLNEGIVDMIIQDSKIQRKAATIHEGHSNLHLNLKKIKPGQVMRIDLSNLFPVSAAGGRIIHLGQRNRSLITDSDGCISLISVKADTLDLLTEAGSLKISTSGWSIPYNYLVGTDGSTVRKSPWVEFRRMPGDTTDVAKFDLLCKTDYPSGVWINGVPVKQYKTGIFFKKVLLNEGVNRVRATVITRDSLSVFYEREFIYEKKIKARPAFPLWIAQKSIEPATDSELLPDDMVRVTFQGSQGQEGYIKLMPGKIRLKCSREDFDDYSVYSADLYLNKLPAGKSYNLVAEISSFEGSEKYHLDFPGKLIIRSKEGFPLVKVKNENSRLTYNLGAPRLGGPIRSELGPGVILKTNARLGDYFRIQLNSNETGFIHKDDVDLLPEGSVVPSYIITSMSCGPSLDADLLTIPYLEPVPYEVFPDPGQKRIVITLFGVQTASTWITHMNNRRIIDRITWQQIAPETYQVFVNLNTSGIWGYDLKPNGKQLVLKVKYPPVFDVTNAKPLSGLKVAIEAGHGGSNTGAMGLSGLPEKEINLDLSLRLGELCKSMGAEVLQVRDSDVDISLIEKRDIAVRSDADILISIHANAGGREYLSVAGTSTYWHNPFWAPLAESIYDRLLELDLKEFGVIGSFNYTVTRVSQMPSVLVEQAFMSNAEDEEKIADPQFRQEMAKKILDGLIDYLKTAN